MISGSYICTSFKAQLLEGCHCFTEDAFFLALYEAGAQLDPDLTTSYTVEGEVEAPGYSAGGQQLTQVQLLVLARTAYVTFASPVWHNSTITARGALLYNATYEKSAVAILDFGGDQHSNMGDFQVEFPPPGPVTSLIRIA